MNPNPLLAGWRQLNQLYRQKPFRKWIYILLGLLSLSFIALAIAVNWNEVRSQQWDFNYWFILLAIFCYPAGMLPSLGAWHFLTKAFGAKQTYWTDLRLYCLSSLPRHIPGFVMFVASRSMLYQEEKVPAALTVAATGAESLLLALTGLILSVSLIPFSGAMGANLQNLTTAAWVAALLLFVLVASTPAINRILRRLLLKRGIQNIPQLNRKSLIASLFWMVIAWIGGGFVLFILAHAILPLDLSLLPALIGMWGAAGAVSLTIGAAIMGLGLREATLTALLSLIMPPLTAVVLAVTFRLVLTLGELLWVLIFLGLTRKKPAGISS